MNITLFKWILFIIAVGTPLYLISNKLTGDLPGILLDDQGSEHVTDIAGIEYNSNPPTSGTHFPMWAKKGVYDRLISDGYLIHSLEHGYVILNYDCTKQSTVYNLLSTAYAHDEPTEESTDSGQLLKHMKLKQTGEMSAFLPENAPEVEVLLPEDFKSESCKNIVNKLSEFVPKFERIIVVPRVGMDTPIALTAWNRIDKLNSIDENRILKFIKAFHNKGPEKTIE